MYQKVFIPIYDTNLHWWLIVIDNHQSVYVEYDSMDRYRNDHHLHELISRWLKSSNLDISTYRFLKKQERNIIPQQHNGDDCGVHMLLGRVHLSVTNVIEMSKETDLDRDTSAFTVLHLLKVNLNSILYKQHILIISGAGCSKAC